MVAFKDIEKENAWKVIGKGGETIQSITKENSLTIAVGDIVNVREKIWDLVSLDEEKEEKRFKHD